MSVKKIVFIEQDVFDYMHTAGTLYINAKFSNPERINIISKFLLG